LRAEPRRPWQWIDLAGFLRLALPEGWQRACGRAVASDASAAMGMASRRVVALLDGSPGQYIKVHQSPKPAGAGSGRFQGASEADTSSLPAAGRGRDQGARNGVSSRRELILGFKTRLWLRFGFPSSVSEAREHPTN